MEGELKLDAPWNQVKERLKEIDYTLTDEDLRYQPDHSDELLERLANKMARTPAEIRAWVESVSSNKGMAS